MDGETFVALASILASIVVLVLILMPPGPGGTRRKW